MMRTYRGVVFEKRKKYTVFLMENGEFVRGIPTYGNPEVGEEVDFELINATPRLSGNMKPKLVGAFMMAAVLFFVIITSFIHGNDQVMAYVQLETNEAVELGVNQAGKVISLRYLNDEPKQQGQFGRFKGKSINEVLDEVVQSVDSQKEVNVTIIYEHTKKQEKVQRVVEGAIQKVQNTNKNVAIEIEKSSMEERGKANRNNMSVHQFKKSQKGAPKNKKGPPSSENGNNNSENKQSNKNAQNESVEKETPTKPSNGKNNGNNNGKNNGNNGKNNENSNVKGASGPKDSKSNQSNKQPNNERNDKMKNSPSEKGKSNNPGQGNGNSNKGNSNPPSKQQPNHQREQPEHANNDKMNH
jgi:hypothetical protein